MANVIFNLRQPNGKIPQPIYLVYRFGRNDKLAYPTGLKILPAYWNNNKMRVRDIKEALGKDIINNRLDELYTVTETHVISLKAKGKPVTKQALRKFLDSYVNNEVNEFENTLHGFISDYLERNKTRVNPNTGKVVSYKTQREHERTYELLKDFETAKNKGYKLRFEDITLDFYADFTTYLQELKLSVNTIGHKIQTLKAWLNEATERGINKNQHYKSHRFRAVTEQTENIYLNETELNQLYNLDLSDNSRLDRVRDLFLVGCWTGLRFSDFTRLNNDNIKNGYIDIEQQKTGKRVLIPLHPVVAKIWLKYGAKLPPNITNQKFNEYIKEVCELAKINNPEHKAITKGGVRVSQRYEKWQLVSSHVARRSFATNLYLGGFPTLSIMQITGHKTETAFMKYIKVTPEQHGKLLHLHWTKKEKISI